MRLAFTDLPTNVELFPVVVFYSLNPGEKVRNLSCPVFRSVFPNLLKVAEHLTKTCWKTLMFRVKLQLLTKSIVNFKFFGEHFNTACGALVVPRAVVGNH